MILRGPQSSFARMIKPCVLGFAVLSLAGACGSKKNAAPAEGSGATPVAATDGTTTAGSAGSAAATATPTPTPPAADLGSCTVTISGAVSATETTGGGVSAISVSHWLDARNKAMMVNPGNEGMLLNCTGERLKVSFNYNVPAAKFPLAPQTLEVTGFMDQVTKVIFLGSVKEPHATFSDATGQLEISAFDASHVAGTFSVAAKANVGGSAQPVTITGTFDLKHPS